MIAGKKNILYITILFLFIIVFGAYYFSENESAPLEKPSWQDPTEPPPKTQRGLSGNINIEIQQQDLPTQ